MKENCVYIGNDYNKLNTGHLTKVEQNLLMAICHCMNGKKNNIITLSFSEIRKLAQYKACSTKAMFSDLNKMCGDLKKIYCHQIVVNENGKRRSSIFDLFTVFDIDEETQTVDVQINERFEYLLNEYKGYTLLELADFTSFRSKYTQNMYRYIRQWVNTKNEIVIGPGNNDIPSIEDFKMKMGCSTSLSTKDFIHSCIEPAIAEINSSSCGIKNLCYEPKKTGYAYSHLTFRWEMA